MLIDDHYCFHQQHRSGCGLSSVIRDLRFSLIATGWVISISSVASTAAMPIAGKASDILGRKFIYICCTILFSLGSFLSAIAPNIESLIFFRLLQGLGAGGFTPSAMGLMADLFPQKRQQMIGLITSVFMIGQVAGPVIGGWLTAAYGWRAVFWFNIPFGIIGLAGGAWLLKSANSGQSKMEPARGGPIHRHNFGVNGGLEYAGERGKGRLGLGGGIPGDMRRAGIGVYKA